MSNWYDGMKFEKSPTPKQMKFSLREWLWAISALCRFWNKKFHAPYMGLNHREAMILMRLRGQRPMTIEELMASTQEATGMDVYQRTPITDVPRVNIGRFEATGVNAWQTFDDHGINVGTSIIRKP